MLTIILSAVSYAVVQIRKAFGGIRKILAAVPMKGWAVLGGLIVLAAFVVFAFRSCRTPEPDVKLNTTEIIKGQQAVAEHNDAQLTEILATSEGREAAADATVDEAKKIQIEATRESRTKWENATFEEKVAEFNRREAAGL